MEWPRGEATACKAVYTGSNPVSTSTRVHGLGSISRAIGAVGARFLDTEEVTGSNPVSPTSIYAGQRPVSQDRELASRSFSGQKVGKPRRILPHEGDTDHPFGGRPDGRATSPIHRPIAWPTAAGAVPSPVRRFVCTEEVATRPCPANGPRYETPSTLSEQFLQVVLVDLPCKAVSGAMAARSRSSTISAACCGGRCSHARRTCHPSCSRCAVVSASRWQFRRIFSLHHAWLLSGIFPCCGHPCQKHPSTNTASLRPGKAMSMVRRRFPGTGKLTL